jgi:hypothetical protein
MRSIAPVVVFNVSEVLRIDFRPVCKVFCDRNIPEGGTGMWYVTERRMLSPRGILI